MLTMRNNSIKFILIVTLFAALGCKQDSGGTTTVVTKSLFSIWTAGDLSVSYDFRGASFGNMFQMNVTYSTGHQCAFNMLFAGSESAGNYQRSQGVYVPGTGDNIDPGCSSIAPENGTYTKTTTTLTACGGGSCDNFY